jgi:hypothetical protein
VLFGDLFFNLIRIAEIDAVRKANIVGTCRDKSVVHPMGTEIALPGNLICRIKFNGVKRAFLDTEPASTAFFIIQENNPVVPLENGLLRTDLSAWRIVTVLTDRYMEDEIQLPFDDLGALFQDLDKPDPVRGLVFLFTGHFAGPASPAGFVIDNQFIFITHVPYLRS